VVTQVEFGVIPAEQWLQPSWIDEERASRAREAMVREGVKYGGSVTYVSFSTSFMIAVIKYFLHLKCADTGTCVASIPGSSIDIR
jgi:hypothetical protein